MRLSVKEAADLADHIEDNGGNASSLRDTISDATRKSVGLKTTAANEASDEEHIAEIRSKSYIDRGTDLECMVCHVKVDELISGTCENCFKEWALTTKRRNYDGK